MKLLDKTKELKSLVKLKFYRIHELTKILTHSYSENLLLELGDLVDEQIDFLHAIHEVVIKFPALMDNAMKEVEIIKKKYYEEE